MRTIVEEICVGPSDRKAAFERLEAELCRGAVVGPEGVALAQALAEVLFASTLPKDPILVARALGRLTLGHVDWLEIHGADGVGTRARHVLQARALDVGRLAASSNGNARAAAIWLATVAGFFDAALQLDESPAAWLFEAHRVRATRPPDPAAASRFVERANALFESDAARERRLSAGLGFVLANPELRSGLTLEGTKDVFFSSVPEDLFVEAFPFRLGRLGELTHAIAKLTYCPSWDREQVGDDPRWFWDPSALTAPIEQPPEPEKGESEPAGETRERIAPDETNPYMIDRQSAAPVTFVLAGLERVDWRSLEDAYGHGGAVPEFLQSLASTVASEREWALHSLYAGINHQGGTFSASVAAVPFLVDLALERRVPEREGVLGLLVGLATGEPQWALLEHKFPTLCIDTVANETERLLPLVRDEDFRVRGKAIHLLGHLESKREAIVPALDLALGTEEDPYLRASIVMAMARVTRRSGDPAEVAWVTAAAERVAEESEIGKAVAALCPFYARSVLGPEERSLLFDLDRRGVVVHPSYAWNGGHIGAHARALHKATMPVEEALDALERGERDCQERASELLFPRTSWKKAELWLPEELSPEQQRFLRWAVKQSQAYYDDFWRDSGLPNTETWLKRFVGELPPGPSDQRVRVEGKGEWPIWKLVYNVLTDRVAEEEWTRVASELSPDELLGVYDDLTSRDFMFDTVREFLDSLDDESVSASAAYRDRFYRSMLDVVVARPELVKAFEERADSMLKIIESSNYRERTLLFAGLGLAAKRAGTEISSRHAGLAEPGDWSPAMTLVKPLRWGLERLPLSLRWHWFRGMRLVSLTRMEDVRGVRHKVRIHNGWEFLDLIPTREAFSAIEEAFEVLDRHSRGEEDPDQELGLTSGPLLTWVKDDALPRRSISRIARAWGPLWQELLSSLKPRIAVALWQELETA